MMTTNARLRLQARDLDALVSALRRRGRSVVAPTVRDGAIVYDHIETAAELPIGWTDEQEPGKYRLKRRNDRAYFGYAVGPHAWKRFLYPPMVKLWQARREGASFRVEADEKPEPPMALLGVRACELAAIAVQDRVLLHGPVADPVYRKRREGLFLVAVNCAVAGGTCFCVSMKTGPKASAGFDLALTEVIDGAAHHFVIESGSAAGAEVLAELPAVAASDDECARADGIVEHTAANMGRHLDTEGIKELFYRNYESPRWEETAKRCMTCSNCTMVCPTCFCSTVEDVSDLANETTQRNRRWDSCFSLDFTHLAGGGSVRSSGASRYRHWITHKLATWIDQFGTSGCVGCGRCITWCPPGIDITQEAAALRSAEQAGGTHAGS